MNPRASISGIAVLFLIAGGIGKVAVPAHAGGGPGDRPGKRLSGGQAVNSGTPSKSGGLSLDALQQLLQSLPKDKQPRPGPDGLIERNEAKPWLVKNMVGKPIELSMRVSDIELEDGGDGKYNVDLHLVTNLRTMETRKLHTNVKIGNIKVGGIPCQVQVWGPMPLWSDLDAAAAKKRRELKGKQVLFKARIAEAEFLEGEDEKQLLLMVGLADVTVLRVEEPQWVKVEMPEGPCTALFPAEPKRVFKPGVAERLVPITEYGYNLPGDVGGFVIAIASPAPEQLRQVPRFHDVAFHLKSARDRVVKGDATYTGKLLKEATIKLGGHVGLEFFMEHEGGTIRERLFYIGGRIFQVIVASANKNVADLTSPDAEKFLNSFTLPPEQAAANAKKQDPDKATDWVTINEGPLTILFPAKPARSRPEGGVPPIKMTHFEVKLGDMEFLANVSDEATAENIRAANKVGDVAARLKKGQREATRNGKILSEGPIRFGKHVGLDYTFLADGLQHRFQAFIFGDRAATLGVTSTIPSDLTGAQAEKFFNSFKWNGKSRTEASTSPPADKPVTYEGKRYQVFTDVLSWHKAKERCEKLGGKLAIVTDAKHNQFLTDLVSNAGLKEAWLGGTDEAVEGKWVTVDGAPIRYTNWGPGQPNNANNNEHYLLLWAERRGVWSDQPSVSKQHRPGYICQWD